MWHPAEKFGDPWSRLQIKKTTVIVIVDSKIKVMAMEMGSGLS